MKYPEVNSLGSYELDERAAIMEFEAGMSREQAENYAFMHSKSPESRQNTPVKTLTSA